MARVIHFMDWHEPVRLLEQSATRLPTAEQVQLAAKVALPITGREPPNVLGAKLEAHLRPSIWGVHPEPATVRQVQALRSLGGQLPESEAPAKSVASAWIKHLLITATAHRLQQLDVRAGIALIITRQTPLGGLQESMRTEEYAIVSAIGANGKVYFDDGITSAWPHQLRRAGPGDKPNMFPKFERISLGSED